MSKVKTGLWTALGALIGGVAGATIGKYAATGRPRYKYQYAEQPPKPAPPSGGRGAGRGGEIEDAMVMGAAAGAVFGSFIAGTAVGQAEAQPTHPPGVLPPAGVTGVNGVSAPPREVYWP